MQAMLPAVLHIVAELLTNTDMSWHGRAAFLVSVETFNAGATVEELWPAGRLVMLVRAPRNQDARQQMTTNDTLGNHIDMLIVLNLVGPDWAPNELRNKCDPRSGALV